MTSPTWSPSEEHSLASYLAEQVGGRSSGTLEEECLKNFPRDVYFAGNLSPMSEHEDASGDGSSPRWLGDLLTKLRPMAFGADFVLTAPQTESELEVKLSWACYFRVFPTLAQQRAHQHSDLNEAPAESSQRRGQLEDDSSTLTEEGEPSSDNDGDPYASLSPEDRRSDRQSQDSLFFRFRKISCKATATVSIKRLPGTGEFKMDASDLLREIEGELKRAGDVAASHPERLRTGGASDSEVQIPQSAIESEEAYSRFLASLNTEVAPQWLWQIRPSIKTIVESDGSEHVELRFEFANATRMPEQSRNLEPFLFDPSAVFRVKSGAHFVPYELDQIPRGFQYDRTLWGRGFNS